MNYNIDSEGYYGEFGGTHVPDVLLPNIEELKANYLKVMDDGEFKAEFDSLLRDYVGRPSPLYFAKNLSEKYGTRIYLKREDLNHTGAHKINNTIGQILMAKRMGKTRIIAETGAGQHGVATATVCALTGMKCVVYMGETDIARQKLNAQKMEMLGAEIIPVTSGSGTLTDAVNEAIGDWSRNTSDTHYIIGSAVGPHPYPDMVAKFQSVISKEIKFQLMEKEGREYPDYLIACIGGGSNAAGTFYHYLNDDRVKLIAAEAAGLGVDSGKSAATIHLGEQGILHGSRTLVIKDEDGKVKEPYSVSAGLDYPGIGPMHAHLAKTKRAEVVAITDDEALSSVMELTRLEGIIPALESSHALGVFGKKKFGPDDIVVMTLSGRGDKDMETYIEKFFGKGQNSETPKPSVKKQQDNTVRPNGRPAIF